MSYAHNFGHWMKSGAFLSFCDFFFVLFFSFSFFCFCFGFFLIQSIGLPRIGIIVWPKLIFSSRQILLTFHPSHARRTDFYAYNSHALPLHALSFVPLSLCCFNISKSLAGPSYEQRNTVRNFSFDCANVCMWIVDCGFLYVATAVATVAAIFIFCVCFVGPKNLNQKMNRDHFPAFLLLRRFIRCFRFLF